MTNRGKKKKQNLLKIITLINFIILSVVVYKVFFDVNRITSYDGYVKGSTSSITLYSEEYEEVDKIVRGSEITIYNKEEKNNEIIYQQISFNNQKYLILKDNITSDKNDIVEEKTLYVRTPLTVYKDSTSPLILGHLNKGDKIDIIGYDKLNNGNVNMYKIKYQEQEGYVYSKYLKDTYEEAMLNYDEEETYAIHKDRHYSKELYGGKASNLDYYPYEKVSFENNELIDEARTLYLNGSEKVLGNIDAYISLAKKSNINAFVVDIKDGFLAYESEVAKTYSMTAYNSASHTKEEYKKIINKIKDNGFYVIGRIVAFNDSHFAKDNVNEAISYKGNATSWTSAYSRKAWEYNVLLASEAVKEFGFNEIQFDYVRFPESSYSMSTNSAYDMKNKYSEEKAQAVQGFLFYAVDELHKLNIYVSVDVFGESANAYVTAYGQYWPAISNIVDVISAMPYPDHFNKYDYGFKEPVWTKPYELLLKWGSSASERQTEIPTPAKVRTWIQAYDAIHEPKIVYDASMVSKQIKALYENGLNNGYITWNAGSSITKYESISSAFKEEYR